MRIPDSILILFWFRYFLHHVLSMEHLRRQDQSFSPFKSAACSQERNIPVWNFLMRNLSSPVSQMYWTSRLSLMLELLKRMQNDCLTATGGPVQKGLTTFLVPSHQKLVVTADKAKANATKLRVIAKEARCPRSSIMVKTTQER